jgi:hypothetical protein
MKHKEDHEVETKQLPAKQKPNYKIMSVAVSSGKVGMVMFKDKQLTVLKTSKKASKSTENAKTQITAWIQKFQPDCIVTEQLDETSRKHGRTPELIEAMTEVIHELPILHCEVSRTQEHQNKFEEAKELSGRYPVLGKYLPNKRKIWEAEDNRMMLFEAAANSQQII